VPTAKVMGPEGLYEEYVHNNEECAHLPTTFDLKIRRNVHKNKKESTISKVWALKDHLGRTASAIQYPGGKRFVTRVVVVALQKRPK